MRMAPIVAIMCAAILLGSGEASGKGWFLQGTAALGRSNQELENSLGAFGFESISAASFSVGGGYLFANRISGTLNLGWSERGGGFTKTTVFRPDGDGVLRQDRSYLDVSSSWTYRLLYGHTTVGVALSPRASILLTEPDVGLAPLRRKVVPGVDPSLSVAYRGLQVIGRYVLDFGPSYRSSGAGTAKVDDSGFFVGLGLELPI